MRVIGGDRDGGGKGGEGDEGDRGDGTEGGEEGKGEGGEDILAQAHRRTGQSDQLKVVQEVLADLKRRAHEKGHLQSISTYNCMQFDITH